MREHIEQALERYKRHANMATLREELLVIPYVKAPLPRISGLQIWNAIPRDAQAVLGSLMIEWFYAEEITSRHAKPSFCTDEEQDPTRRAISAATDILLNLIRLEIEPWIGPELEADVPRVPSGLGDVCRGCGCSAADACPSGCSWVADELCSDCAKPKETTT